MTGNNKIRVRIAPSPTGLFHIGTARTALFNYIFAKQKKGQFVLRIEDTDVARSKKEYEKDIIEGLNWLGLEPNEGPVKGGDYGPYRQSSRKSFYKKYLQKLLKEGKAFYCFTKRSGDKQEVFWSPDRDLSLKEAQKKASEGKNYIIRFKTPRDEKVLFKDLVRGEVEIETNVMGDFSLAKSLDEPLYNFAAVIDDKEMEISHVIRGEDHLSNTPKQILLQKALGFEIPIYGHLPLILGEDKSKLSKRNNTVSLSKYKEQGYLPEALVNFMALLGWGPGDDREVFSKEELVKEFSFDKVHQSGAVFNIEKLDWLNGYYIRNLDLDKLTNLIEPYFSDKTCSREYLKKIVVINQERLKKLSDIKEGSDFYFEEPDYSIDLLLWKDMTKKELQESLEKSLEILQKVSEDNFNTNYLQELLLKESKSFDNDRGKILWPLRAALTGAKQSPSPFEVAATLGKDTSLKYLQKAIEMTKS